MHIGILDSNLSGLVIARQLRQYFPEERFCYYADTLRAPYDNKRPETILAGVRQGITHLLQYGVEAVVSACPIISATVLGQVRSEIDLPVVDVIDASVRQALQLSRHMRFGLLGPRSVIDSGAHEQLIRKTHPQAFLFTVGAGLLPHMVDAERAFKTETRMIVKKYLHPFKMRRIDTLILACNHAAVLAKLIQAKAGRGIRLVLPTAELAAWLKAIKGGATASPHTGTSLGAVDLFASEVTDCHRKQVARYLKKPLPLTLLPSN